MIDSRHSQPAVPPLLALAAFAPWIPWVWQMRVAWSSAPEYYFGWAVPVLALYLAWLRWRDRPRPSVPGVSGGGGAWVCFVAGAAGLAVASVLLEPNPLWTAAGWAACAAALGMTFSAVYATGGSAWLRHFLWPGALLLSALAWPAWLQVPVMEALKSSNASLAADLVSTLGYPAIAHGSSIELARGMVGVEDACSGIRSLQTAIMTALFLGELLRLPLARRFVLGLGALAVALGANLARTGFLAWSVAARGPEFAERAHDLAGLAEVAVALALVFALSLRLEPRTGVEAQAMRNRAGAGGFSAAWTAALVAGAVLAPAAAGLWYPKNGDNGDAAFVWRLSAPDSSWQARKLSPVEEQLLGCDRVEFLGSGPRGDGECVAAHLVWDRDPSGRYVAGLHHPDVCLSNAGARLVADEGPFAVDVAGRTIAFDQMAFDAGGVRYQVFFTVWDSSRGGSIGVLQNNAVDFGAERWRLVREHRRRLVMEQLTFAFGGESSASAARSRLAALLQTMLSRGDAP